jgi:hypothetical protein
MSRPEAIMELNPANHATPGRVLVVADWTADAQAVVSACAQHRELRGAALGLAVPARLHGLDWVGDPTASIPCAERQLTSISRLAAAAGFSFHVTGVGDPDPLAAICDALADWPADELLVCARATGLALSHPLDLVHRARRLTGLTVSRVALPANPAPQTAPGRWRLPRGHCVLDQASAA